jgi:predicted RNase H-like HicB family nuclease
MKKHYPVIIEQDNDGVFIVECPLFKGCRSYGYSVDEALRNIREAIEACIEDTPSVEDRITFVGVRDLEIGAP